MLDLFSFPSSTANEIFTFSGNAATTATGWQVWNKPRGKSMCAIRLFGTGGNGGTGVIGAVSTAAGGGGGASGAQSSLIIPIDFLPDQLFLSLPHAGVGGAAVSYISIVPASTTVNHLLLTAKGGSNGGNASGATAGSAGTAGVATVIGDCPLAAMGIYSFIAGQAGIIGGTTGAAGALTLPVTGLIITGGTGGAGLGASASAGTAGGAFTIPASPTIFPAHAGGLGTATATVPPGNGEKGLTMFGRLQYFYGGTGGGSTHGSATGGGLVQSSGGDGAPGCGGGGMGGALTASSAGVVGKGGEGYCIITTW